jgi:hypothetical protein
MTEAQWLACEDPTPMLEFLLGKASDRKLRLFAAARCRLFRPDWDDLWPIREAVDAAEQFSDGLSPSGQFARFHRPWQDFIWDVRWGTMDPTGGSTVLAPYCLGQLLVQAVSSPDAGSAARGVLYDDLQSYFDGLWKDGPRERGAECHLLREVFGNPFRPAALDPAWLAWNGGAVRKMAQAIYEERRFSDLPILADALEDAGCHDPDILAHCRGPSEHVRGCWVVDLLTGRQ